jgi:hypothetical protein
MSRGPHTLPIQFFVLSESEQYSDRLLLSWWCVSAAAAEQPRTQIANAAKRLSS